MDRECRTSRALSAGIKKNLLTDVAAVSGVARVAHKEENR